MKKSPKLLTLLAAGLLSTSAHAGSPTIPEAVQAQLASCDVKLVRQAANGILRAPETLTEPFMLAGVISDLRYAGDKEDAAFMELAMRLRGSRQLLFERDWRPEMLELTRKLNGPMVMSAIEADPMLASRVVQRVIDWDRATPDPYRERALAAGGEFADKLGQYDADLASLPEQLQDNPARVEQARQALLKADQDAANIRQRRCDPGRVDAVYRAAAAEAIKQQATKLVQTAPMVLKRAGGQVKSASLSSSRGNDLPVRLTFTVVPAKGKNFYAEVDVKTSVTRERKLGTLQTRLACITEHGNSQRPSNFRDVCVDDPEARRP
jgi:hypothetical protein